MDPCPPAVRPWHRNLLDQQLVKIFEIRGVVYLLLEDVEVRLMCEPFAGVDQGQAVCAWRHARLLLQVEQRQAM